VSHVARVFAVVMQS